MRLINKLLSLFKHEKRMYFVRRMPIGLERDYSQIKRHVFIDMRISDLK